MSHPYRSGGTSGTLLCEHCHSRPRFGAYEYCGKTCADLAKKKSGGGGFFSTIGNALLGSDDDWGAGRTSSQYPSRTSAPATYGASVSVPAPGPNSGDNMCELCHARPKHKEKDPRTGNTIVYSFCGRTCRNVNAQMNPQRCQLRDCGNITGGGPYCSEKHAKKAVSRGEAVACAYCKQAPAAPGYEYCTKDCGMLDAREKEKNSTALTLIPRDRNNAQSIAKRFYDRWSDPEYAVPDIVAIYQINVARKYEDRFKAAVQAAERLGGSTTKSAFYGGQCICDLGVPQYGSEALCLWGSCSICIVIRKCFDVLEFKNLHHTGSLGKGIYANLNPAHANRFTVRKSAHPVRAIILCSIIHLDEFVQGSKKSSAYIEDDTGRVFCESRDVILPRQLILYNSPDRKPTLI